MNEIRFHMDITQLNENFGQNGLRNTLEKHHDKPAEWKQRLLQYVLIS